MSRVAAWGCCIVGVLLVAVAVARADGPGQGPRPKTKPTKCKVATAALVKQAAAAREYTRKSFAAALGRQKLAPARIAWRQSGDLGGGWLSGAGAALGLGKVAGTSFVEGGATYIAGPMIQVPNGSIPIEHLEFATDAAGDLVQVVRAPRVKLSRTVVVCGCGPVGSGVPPHDEQIYYEVPAGVTFRGQVKVAYNAKVVNLVPSRTQANGAVC